MSEQEYKTAIIPYIRDIIELIEEALDTRSFDENAADASMEKELNDIANRLWKIKTKLRGEE
jgi:hypothetical protein